MIHARLDGTEPCVDPATAWLHGSGRLGEPQRLVAPAARHRPRWRLLAQAAWSATASWRMLLALRLAPRDSALGRLVAARPEVWSTLATPFVSVGWSGAERLRRIVDHCAAVERIGRPFDLAPTQYAELPTLDAVTPGLRLTLDQPRWLFRDGLLALSLWQGGERLFSLTFVLVRTRAGLVAQVGGLQGMRDEGARARYRALTKAACGMRPADLLIELFRTIAGAIGARRISCVSDATRHQRSAYFTSRADYADAVTLDYDATWTERGATLRRDGMFVLPLVAPVRAEADIAPRKRGMYRRRRQMLAGLQGRLRAALAAPEGIAIHEHDPRFLAD